ncbi:MAG: Histidine kinase [Verrucomicrobia bacterium]|nr:Histidine kinase [Verrucomicrobiota bacterium]
MPSLSTLRARASAWLSLGDRRVYVTQVGVVLIVITLLNLGFIHQRALREIAAQHKLPRVVRGWDGFAWYAWVLAAPVMLVLIRRFPLTPETVRRNLWRLLAGNAAVYVAVTNVRYLFRILPNVWLPDAADLPITWDSYWHTTSTLLPLDFLTYAGFFAASVAIDNHLNDRRRANEMQRLQLKAARLQSELARAKLATLRGQLHPHFLFNSFNAIAMLVRQRKLEPAVETITQLSGLLRLAIDHIDQPELLLAQEIDFIGHYLDIERIRFGGKLQTRLRIDGEALTCVVPGLLLQPLVENAIKHGISQRVAPGMVEIEARREGDRLCVTVLNDGPEIEVLTKRRTNGIGLENTRRRLRHMYQRDFSLEMEHRADGRTALRVSFPWRRAFTPAPEVSLPEEAYT